MSKGSLYWGYLDDHGKIFVKKYVNDKVIQNYEAMPFVKGIFGPFYADNIQMASALISARYQQELN